MPAHAIRAAVSRQVDEQAILTLWGIVILNPDTRDKVTVATRHTLYPCKHRHLITGSPGIQRADLVDWHGESIAAPVKNQRMTKRTIGSFPWIPTDDTKRTRARTPDRGCECWTSLAEIPECD